MTEKQRENTDGVTSEQRRTQWVRPETNRLEAGAAEFGDISNPDGAVNS